jgi:hypothetical protein
MNQKDRKNTDGTNARGRKVAACAPAQNIGPIDDVAWLLFLEPNFQDRPEAAETLARYLFELKEAIESGPEGIRGAVESLGEGIRLAYLYTETHRAALHIFCLHLAGELVETPNELLDAKIKDSLEDMRRRGTAPPKFLEATGDRAVK